MLVAVVVVETQVQMVVLGAVETEVVQILGLTIWAAAAAGLAALEDLEALA